MPRTPATSSNIVAIGHDPKTNVLEVEFKGGAVYHYSGVDADKYDALLNAKSVGSHFHHNIRSSNDFTKKDQI